MLSPIPAISHSDSIHPITLLLTCYAVAPFEEGIVWDPQSNPPIILTSTGSIK
uniref:Uncharacterized protein n=1 Tax=viral metagenome TaxID=1070528 RepID=A0A6C0BNX1_9ZZZZ